MSPRSPLPAILLALLGVLFIAFAIFYATTDTALFASGVARHYKHATVAAVLGPVSYTHLTLPTILLV